MFSKSVDNTRHVNGPAHTLISRSTEIVGDIHFSGELIIEGKVKGNISVSYTHLRAHET